MTSMKAAVWTGPNRVVPMWVDRPDVPENWALVRISHTGLCGTDLAIFYGQHPRAKPPLIMGHELSGFVEISRDPRISVGDLVIAEPLISCGECWACLHGEPHVCRRLGLYGIDAPGGLAEFVALPAHTLHVLPPETDSSIAALVEPLAVAVHAVSKSGLVQGDTVAIFGAGPIGILTALVAQNAGASNIIVSEPNPWRAALAADFGFIVAPDSASMPELLREMTDDEGADVTFDTAGHPSVSPFLADATRVLGTIVIVGVHKEQAPVDLRRLNFAEQRMQGVRVYTSADVDVAIQLVSDDALGLGRIPIREFGIDDIDEAFTAAQSGERNLKVMVAPA